MTRLPFNRARGLATGRVTLAIAAALFGAPLACTGGEPRPISTPLSVLQALGPAPDDARYARALGPREFDFPTDHGPHGDFRSEWWYWTGNLEGPAGHRFGYQFTVFRNALAPPCVRFRRDSG